MTDRKLVSHLPGCRVSGSRAGRLHSGSAANGSGARRDCLRRVTFISQSGLQLPESHLQLSMQHRLSSAPSRMWPIISAAF